MERVQPREPLVSVGVPVYNGERFIREALDSVLAQTYRNLEIVVCDNASTDTTAVICGEYAAKDRRIRYCRNPVNIGVHANFWRVLELSSGQFFTWAAADDLRPKTAVEDCLMALLRNRDAVMAHGPVLVKGPGDETLIERSNAVCLSDRSARKRVAAFTNGIKHNAFAYGLYRRHALARCTFRNTPGSDYLLGLQMCLLGPIEYVPTPMIIFCERGLPVSNNPMYAEQPITVMTLLILGGQKRKCWTVLIRGCYYLATIGGVDFAGRVGGIVGHLCSFVVLYRSRLAKEIVFRLFSPVVWLSKMCWGLARRWEFSSHLGLKLRALLRRT
jgi:glycosyltransferase involved in cell wall biosynthesis